MLRIVKSLTLCSLTLTLAMASSSSRGDIPLPPNLKYIDPVVRFDGLAKLPDYEFRLRFITFVGGPSGVPATYKSVTDGSAFPLGASRRLLDMQLLGLKRDEFARRAKEDPSLRWLTDETPHVLAADVPTPSTTGKATEAVPVTNYRVSMKDGQLIVERIAADPETKAEASTWWKPLLKTSISLLARFVGVALLGLWIFRGLRFGKLSGRRAGMKPS